ncbi:MAG: alanine racemase, partial [Muribaculaceae bacterium]|nr:alanine racemase [Muribaculaceae bacterium]
MSAHIATDGHEEIDTLLTDSRSLTRPETSLFFAIRTPGGNDGHKFIEELYKKGVRHFVVNEIPEDFADKTDVNFIVTDDVVTALQKIASYASHLIKNKVPLIKDKECIPGNSKECQAEKDKNSQAEDTAIEEGSTTEIVGITGSRGKTTVKEWIFQLMEPLCEIARSPRSFNSQIGVPLSLWEIEPTTELALIEAGISKPGEMKILADCIQPQTVIITNIGDAHADGFKSLKEKAEEKATLTSPDSVKTIIYNIDSPYLKEAIEKQRNHNGDVKEIAWSISKPEADVYLQAELDPHKDTTEVRYTFQGKKNTITAPVKSKEELENVGAALSFMLTEGISEEVIKERFKHLHRIGTRLNVTEGVNNCSIIHDSYTSDFSSLRPAINFMIRRAMPHQHPTLILSDIRHETSGGSEIYEAIAEAVKESGVERFIGVGEALKAHSHLFGSNATFFDSTEQFLQKLSPSDFDSEIILVKGAPEFDFSRISEMLEARKHETVLEVNLDAIVENYNYFRSHLPEGTGIVAMVKAFGYGAGSYEIAKTLQDSGAAYLAVAVLDEGIDLRRNGITMPIMVMNPKVVNYKSMFANRLEPEVYSLDMLRDVIREAEKNNVKDYPIHLKLDTGMHRTGLLPYELQEAIDLILSQKGVKLASMFSH